MPDDLPRIIETYLAASDANDSVATLATFHHDAVVVDDDHTFSGHDAIGSWLAEVRVYTTTRTLIDVDALDHGTYSVRNHVEGDFPGGQVDLRYGFQIRDGLIARLEISP